MEMKVSEMIDLHIAAMSDDMLANPDTRIYISKTNLEKLRDEFFYLCTTTGIKREEMNTYKGIKLSVPA